MRVSVLPRYARGRRHPSRFAGGFAILLHRALHGNFSCARSECSVEEIGGVLQDDGHQALYEVALERDGPVQGVAVGVVEELRD